MRKSIKLIESKNIYDYKLVLEGLFDDDGFGYPFLDTMLVWCNVMTNKPDGKFWQVWLIQYGNKKIGVCGLFSHNKTNKQLWLGWFGLHPKFRNKKIGAEVLSWMEQYAKSIGCKEILSYVDKQGTPLPFYYKQSYTNIGTVRNYLIKNKESEGEFEDLDDHVISKKLI